MALALIAAALAGDAAIDWGVRRAGFAPHWADGFFESLLWEPLGTFLIDAFSAIVWAPIIEELVFRGLLYGTLRTRLGVWPSALASAVIFALPHGYAVAGSLSVLMSGVLWALAYERTRSLLAGHARALGEQPDVHALGRRPAADVAESGGVSPAEVLGEPVEDDAEALEAVARLAGPRQLVVLVGEAHEHDLLPELLQRDEELLGLLDRAAEVVLGVHDQERRADVARVGQRRALQVAVEVVPRRRADARPR